MGSAFHQLCPRYSGTLTLTASTDIRVWETFTYTFFLILAILTLSERVPKFKPANILYFNALPNFGFEDLGFLTISFFFFTHAQLNRGLDKEKYFIRI